MAGEEARPGDSGSVEDVREHEEEARRARAGAEGERAAAEREHEGGDGGGEGGVLPAESDEERTGVMPSPGGGGPD
jgi:hypothetical protein